MSEEKCSDAEMFGSLELILNPVISNILIF
jgi:hypothetical protein